MESCKRLKSACVTQRILKRHNIVQLSEKDTLANTISSKNPNVS